MKNFMIVLILPGLLVLQSTLMPFFQISGVVPDLLLIYLIPWCLRHNRSQGIIIGFLSGFLQDLADGGTAGFFALSKSVVCYLSCSIIRSRHEHNPIFTGLLLLVTALLEQTVQTLFASRLAAADFGILLLRYGLPSAFYTGVLGMSIYGVGRWIKHNKRQTRWLLMRQSGTGA